MTPIGLPEDPPELLAISQPNGKPEPARDAISMLTPAQRRAAWALATGSTMTAAAQEACVDRRTIYSWKQLPHFAEALDAGVELFSSFAPPASAATHARVVTRCPEIGDELVRKALNPDDPDQFRAISKALEVAGLTGPKGAHQQTNVQVNVSTDGGHRTAQDEALRIIEARKADVRQAASDA